VSDESRAVTAADLEALRVELREALTSVMDEILNSVHSVAPPVRSQVQLAETRLAERLDEIERMQTQLATSVQMLRANVASLRKQLGESTRGDERSR
jgi:hypothetical protein